MTPGVSMMSLRMHVQLLVLSVVVLASGCATANVGGDVSSAPVTVPPTEGGVVSPLPAPVVGGAPVTAADPSVLRGGVWVLIALGATEVTPAVRNPAHLSFAEATRVSGATGCNRLSGSVTVDEGNLRFGPLVTTRMACPGGGDLEARFLKALEVTRAWGIEAGTLRLRDAGGDTVATLEHREALPGA
jgi:heat shock protein HslJ